MQVLFLIAQMNVWDATLSGASALRRLQGKLATRTVPGCVRLADITIKTGPGNRGQNRSNWRAFENLGGWTSIVGILWHSLTHPGKAIFWCTALPSMHVKKVSSFSTLHSFWVIFKTLFTPCCGKDLRGCTGWVAASFGQSEKQE